MATLLVAMMCGGCASTTNGVNITWKLILNDEGKVEPEQTATIEDVDLAKKINLTPLGLVNHSGVITAMNAISSLTTESLALEFRIDWLNDDGTLQPRDFVLWNYFILQPGDSRFLNSNLPGTAAGYRLSIRRK